MTNLLYKYLDANGAKKMLELSNLMYTNATMFNDPFDCHPGLIDFSNVPPEACKCWSAEDIEGLHSNKYSNYRDELWICCLTKKFNSILMWSYYNNHEGVCIGLNMDKVSQCLGAQYGLTVTSYAREVQYKNAIEKPNFYRDKEDFFNYQVYTKAKAWEHEQEVRLFIYEPSPRFMGLLSNSKDRNKYDNKELKTFVKLTAECFESIYLGIKISTEDKKDIIQKARALNPNIKIYQMEIDAKSFNVIDNPINLE